MSKQQQSLTEFFRNKIQSSVWTPRTGEFKSETLRRIFPEGVEPVIKIRQLTLTELVKVREADDQMTAVKEMVEALAGAAGNERTEALKRALGLGDEVPSAAKKAHIIISLGTVEPQIDLESAVYLGEYFPVEASQLSQAILTLTGQGAELGKS